MGQANHFRSLPRSFRFGTDIADLLTRFIRHYKSLPQFQIEGDPSKETVVQRVPDCSSAYHSALANGGQISILARKNSTLFSEVVDIVTSAEARLPEGVVPRLYFVGGWRSYSEQVLWPVQDLHRLASEEYAEIQDPFVRRYDTLDKLRFVVDSQEMVDWKVK